MSVEPRVLRLRSPWRSSHGTLCERELLAVTITDEDGVSGHGEAAPLQAYDGVNAAHVRAALERYTPVLAASADMNGAQIIDACRLLADIPAALAAIDLALWDRAGKRLGKPVAALLTDNPEPSVQVNAAVSATEPRHAAAAAEAAVAAGFQCVKLKVGSGDDRGRVRAVRAAVGGEPSLRLDANGAWSVEQAVATIEELGAFGLELIEEPTHGLEAVRKVRERVSARISIDETAGEHGALGAGVADAVCLKISRCGGISGLIAAATLVRASGAEVYLASTLDGPLGIAAAVHAAAALASRGPVAPCGLATLGLFENLEDPLPPRGGAIAVPTAPGLGVLAP
jgi:L-alanine-DL-glutamate epimerase-like enolase superfamily enzyme